jgi:hypothetical protein
MTFNSYRRWRRILIIVAAAPLIQLSACQTGFNQVAATVLNNLPSTLFSIVQSALLAPFITLLSGGGTTGGVNGGGGI